MYMYINRYITNYDMHSHPQEAVPHPLAPYIYIYNYMNICIYNQYVAKYDMHSHPQEAVPHLFAPYIYIYMYIYIYI